jgi:isopenicillin-N N-acyltransferase-like protein
VRDLLTAHIGTIGTQHVTDALFDSSQTPYSVCRPPRPSATSGEGHTASLAMVVMQPAARHHRSVSTARAHREFTVYRVGVDRAVRCAAA